jgi:hypothetical protein
VVTLAGRHRNLQSFDWMAGTRAYGARLRSLQVVDGAFRARAS